MNARLQNNLILILLGSLLFIPFLGGVHLFDWDEINFAESAREMILTKDWSRVQINFHVFWEKPPLFIWLQAISMSLFGINEFSARLPNALVGISTLLVIFNIGRKQVDGQFAWIWVIVYLGTFLPHFYFKSGIIDPLFNLFIFLSIYKVSQISTRSSYTYGKNLRMAIMSGIYLGLAVLTKGPVAILIVVTVMFFFWLMQRLSPIMRFYHLFLMLLMTIAVSCLWFGYETYKNGFGYLMDFYNYQVRLFSTPDGGHGGPFYYHFILLLVGCFPASAFVLSSSGFESFEKREILDLKRWMGILLFVVLLIFSIVKTKIVHYSSLSYFPITFLATYSIYKIITTTNRKLKFIEGFLVVIIGIVISLLLFGLPYIANHQNLLTPYIHDIFVLKALHASILWQNALYGIGIFYLLIILFAIYFIRKSSTFIPGFWVLFLGSILCIQLMIYFFVSRVEGYSQRAAIEFFKSKSNEDAYLEVIGFKSYAHLFYGNKKPEANQSPAFKSWLKNNKNINTTSKIDPEQFDNIYREWLLKGPIDKNAYFVLKTQREEEYLKLQGMKKIGEKNGFVFLERRLTQ